MREELNTLRVDIDAISQLTKDLTPDGFEEDETSNELYATHTSLLLGKAWIGKLLGTMGGTSPYLNDGHRKEVKDIEPTDARATMLGEFKLEGTHTEKVDTLRQYVQTAINKLEALDKDFKFNLDRNGAICRTQVWVHLTEARLHLGFELGRVREEAINEQK